MFSFNWLRCPFIPSYAELLFKLIICCTGVINPRRMHGGYGSRSVCLSVTALAATYLVCKSKVRCYKFPYGVSNLCILWISLKTHCSPVLASFAYNRAALHAI